MPSKDHHHNQSSSVASHLTGISSIKPINPSTNTSALPIKIQAESFEGSHSDRVNLNISSEKSFGEQFYQLSEGDVPNLQPVEISAKIAISKPIPSIPEPVSPQIYSQEESVEARIESNDQDFIIESLFCTVCHNDQPLRARHCSQCKECVAMFDHHCPFLGNCVGEKNRLMFFWFVLFQNLEI